MRLRRSIAALWLPALALSVLVGATAQAQGPAAGRASLAPPAGASVPYLISEWIWALPGQPIREEAKAQAPLRFHLPSLSHLPVLGRQGSWAKVLYSDTPGWLDTGWQPSHDRKKARRGILRHRTEPITASDTWRLKQGREILGPEHLQAKLGGYDLYTDLRDRELLDFLDAAARHAPEAYFARYGRLPAGDPKRTVLLFATLAGYERYVEATSELPTSGRTAGHAGAGILAFFAEGRPREELARTLVHEIGHLLNTRALTLGLPPWLEEGMASDLGALWLESDTQVRDLDSGPGQTTGYFRVPVTGPEVRLIYLAKVLAVDQLPSISTLWKLSYENFHKEELERYAYAHSLALIRFLMDGDGGRYSDGFREYLKRIAAGKAGNPKVLLKLLSMSTEELDRGLHAWLRAETQAIQQRVQRQVAEEKERRRRAFSRP